MSNVYIRYDSPVKCSHESFEELCQERHDILFSDNSGKTFKIDGKTLTFEELIKVWGGTSDSEWKCSDCGKSGGDMASDLNDINPNRRVSQQPHGKSVLFCNLCDAYVIPTSFGGEDDICPYHQRTYEGEEGTVFMYDEFNQDGEAW